MNLSHVSTVIPVYNGANYICDAIDSALTQTYPNFEVIVVNDGSTDNTEELCLSYGDSIKYFKKENGGVSSALNMGIREMQGDYFTWLAHDDVYYPHKLEAQIQALSKFKDKETIIHGNYDLVSANSNEISHMRQEDSYSTEQLSNSVFPILNTCAHASTYLIHKSHFERVGMFNENLPLSQDYDFLFRAMRGQQSVFVSEPLLLSRLHSQSGKNTDNRFASACGLQYEHFANSLTYDEVQDMFASPKAFYVRTAAMMQARGYYSGASNMLKKINTLPYEEPKEKLATFLQKCANDNLENIYIFGAGYYGKVLKFELKIRNIHTFAFIDNNAAKHNTYIEGIPCFSPASIVENKDNSLIIIAADVSDSIERQLHSLSFPNVITKKKLDSIILDSPPEMELLL